MKNPRLRNLERDKAGKAIKRLWGDVPVTDAIADIRLFILQQDLDHAKRADAGECVFAQACKRQFGSTKVMFWKSIAYVELPAEDGSIRVERFQMTGAMRKLVEDFDKGRGIIPKAGFLLRAPRPGRRLDQQRNKRAERAMILGEMVDEGNIKRKVKRARPVTIDMAIRNGSGAVHFSTAPSDN